jgi:flagellin
MTISIQGSGAAVLAALEPLAGQSGAAGTATAQTANANTANASRPIIDLSGLSTGAFGGAPASSLASGASIADAAVASGSIVEGLLEQMRNAAVSAANPDISDDARASLNAGFLSGLSQIQAAVGAAGVDGVNLLDGSASAQTSGGLATYDLSLGGPVIGVPAGASLSDPATAASLADQLESAMGGVGQAVSTIAGQSDAMQSTFASQVQSGPAGFVPTLDADGARLAALQVQQQLSTGAGSIVSQTPAAILALFR